MDIWEEDKLKLFLAFVIPGFLSLKTYAAMGIKSLGDSSQQLIDAVAFSCINYALLAWPILAVEASNWQQIHPQRYLAFYAFVLLGAPVLWGVVWMLVRKTQLAQRFLPHPIEKAWDYVFSRRTSHWVIVTLTNGTRIGGKFAERSFCSSAPHPEQIYLEEAWHLAEGGGFDRPLKKTQGILVLGAEIAFIQLFELTQDNHGNEAHSDSPAPTRLATLTGAERTETR